MYAKCCKINCSFKAYYLLAFVITFDMPEKLKKIEDSYLKFVDDFIYNLEVLNKDSDDYKLIEKSFKNTSSKFAKNKPKFDFSIVRICKIHQKVPKLKNVSTKNILIFHGTPRKNVDEILKHGFKPSTSLFSTIYIFFYRSTCYKCYKQSNICF